MSSQPQQSSKRTTSSWRILASAVTLACAVGTLSAAGMASAQTFIGPNPRAMQALMQPISNLKVRSVPLERVIGYLRNLTNANFVVNWNALESANVTKQTQISLNLHGVSMARVLDFVLQQASPNAPLVYSVEDNVISITTRHAADKRMLTRVYNIGDLIMTVPNFSDAPDFNLQSATSSGQTQINGGSGGLGGGGAQQQGSLFQNSGGQGNGGGQRSKSPRRRAKSLIRLIEQTIRPNIWTANGGRASIRYFRQRLVVTAPADVQQEIGGTVASSGGLGL